MGRSALMRGERSARVAASQGLTLVEILVVLSILSLLLFIAAVSFGSVRFWHQERALRRLISSIEFLHHQAIADRIFYGIRVDLDAQSYEVGVLRAEADINLGLSQQQGEIVGNLTLELADFLTPFRGDGETFLPPKNFPSLAGIQKLPDGFTIEKVTTSSVSQTRSDGGTVLIYFSPHGVSDFGVLHLYFDDGRERTVLIDPFSGRVQVYDEIREFEWTLGDA